MQTERHELAVDAGVLQAQLRQVYWIGGGSDAMFTQHLYEEARRLELNTIEVDTTMTVDDLASRVTEAFTA